MKKSIFGLLSFGLLNLSPLSTTSIAAESLEFRASAGYQSHNADWLTADPEFNNQDFSDSGIYFGISLKNRFGKNNNHLVGVGIDIDSILDERVIGYRAIDYQYVLNKKWRIGGFIGAATIDTGLPQNGYYLGANGSYFFSEKISLTAEIRHGNGLARDRVFESDPEQVTELPDIFLDYSAFGLQVDWHF